VELGKLAVCELDRISAIFDAAFTKCEAECAADPSLRKVSKP
jgi:hypothetical protein